VSDLDNIGDRLLVIFDGHCGLCNRLVRWFLRRDRQDRLRFVPFDSLKAAGLLARHGLALNVASGKSGTILVAQAVDTPAERVFVRSDAVLVILRQLPAPWPAVAVSFRIIPRALRDLGYRLVARSRYRIWGHLDSCPIPTPQERARFQ
jgi:predicted DCC family thiol-disulfide oxidoreductase YuxK